MTGGRPGALSEQRAGEQDSPARAALQSLLAPIENELAEVEEILRRELQSRFPRINDLVQHGIRLGGKRLRPALLLLVARACGRLTSDHLLLAAVIEMIHTATLVHDDVLDEAVLRRHRDTVNARYDNEASILLGDYLFSHAYYLASTLRSTFACRQIGRSTNIVCQGELLQVASRGNYGMTEAQYLQIIEGKTAELCACSCLLGARYAGAPIATQRALRRYGRHLGMAFQIIDDLLDLLGDEEQTGKSLGTDLEKAKPTLPLIRLLKRAEAGDRNQLLGILRQPAPQRRSALLPLLEVSGALDDARRRAARYAQQAQEQLVALAESPARAVLEALPEFVVTRRN